MENHITLLKERQHQNNHFAAVTGSSQSTFNGSIAYFDSNETNFAEVAVITSDGTAVHTGRKGGVIEKTI